MNRIAPATLRRALLALLLLGALALTLAGAPAIEAA
jgi:hypothetical protein